MTTEDPTEFGGVNATLGATNSDNSGGGDIIHNQTGFIGTAGDFSPGAVIQSIGGGGGSAQILVGSLTDAAASAAATNSTVTPALTTKAKLLSSTVAPLAVPLAVPPTVTTAALGATGGSGNDGGTINTSFSGGFQTQGAHSAALIIQSIGAGGGQALIQGDDSPNVVLGGNSGATGSGEDITVENDGSIYTEGKGSHAVLLQSIGGGGGAVFGDFTSPTVTLSDDNSGDAGDIDYTQHGDIVTLGDGALGIIAQSIGGGGGFVDGTFAGTAGGSGAAGALSLDVNGTIYTQGDRSYAVFMQSVGDGIGGVIDYDQSGDIVTWGDGAIGLIMQSLGGPGGNPFAGIFAAEAGTGTAGPLSVHLDGSIFTAGDGAHAALIQTIGGGDSGTINYVQTGDIVTQGDGAVGVIAQSLAGGGGFAANSFGNAGGTGDAGSIAFKLNGSVLTKGDGSHGVLLQSVGGGDGGDIDYKQTGDVSTVGAGAIGVIAQSLAGGGGFADGTFGNAGGTGDAGSIAFDVTGSISTLGAGAHGVLLQTIGGGDAGSIDYTQTGDIVVTGADSVGLIAQSLGGGGSFDGATLGAASVAAKAAALTPLAISATGTGGPITLDVSGSIVAPGVNSVAVFAQSDGPDGGGNVTLTTDGDIRGGSGTGVGVRIIGGADNLFSTSGTLSAVSGVAMEAGTGNDRLENYGTVVGNVFLGSGNNSVFNAEGATFMTIDTVDLDGLGGGTFTNSGDLLLGRSAPRYPIDLLAGETWDSAADSSALTAQAIDPAFSLYLGTGVISQVTINGSFVQTDTGYDAFDIAFGPYDSDLVTVTGDATVDGTAESR